MRWILVWIQSLGKRKVLLTPQPICLCLSPGILMGRVECLLSLRIICSIRTIRSNIWSGSLWETIVRAIEKYNSQLTQLTNWKDSFSWFPVNKETFSRSNFWRHKTRAKRTWSVSRFSTSIQFHVWHQWHWQKVVICSVQARNKISNFLSNF